MVSHLCVKSAGKVLAGLENECKIGKSKKARGQIPGKRKFSQVWRPDSR